MVSPSINFDMNSLVQYKNNIVPNPQAVVLFIDMNSFFASCEQQENPMLRGKPIGVCGNHSNGVIIAPSIEAKLKGVKTGMRMPEARMLCPNIISVEPKSAIYRKFHIGIMNVLRSYSEDVIPKSIDEAVVNLTSYKLVYPDMDKLANQIKKDIKEKVGDWLQCSIGIAPNTFLAKLATDMQKPNGLVHINAQNIDEVLRNIELTDLPGIAERSAAKLKRAGIKTPYEMRHTSPQVLKKIMGGVIGYYWHYRLNFAEVDFYSNGYKSMSAVRTLSQQQRNSPKELQDIFLSLCMKLETRMVKHHFFCKTIGFTCSYQNHTGWDTHINMTRPLQDGTDIYKFLSQKIMDTERERNFRIFTPELRTIGVLVNHFITDKNIQYELFDNNIKRDFLRKTVYEIKDQFGNAKIIKAVEMREKDIVRDIIGFGSVKDMYN
jgi:DNA polymerase-4